MYLCYFKNKVFSSLDFKTKISSGSKTGFFNYLFVF